MITRRTGSWRWASASGLPWRFLYGLATIAGVLALCVRNFPTDVSMVLILGFIVCLTFFAIHLARVQVYAQDEPLSPNSSPLTGFLIDLSHKRGLFEVLLDMILIGMAYYVANLVFYGPLGDDGALDLLLNTLPILVIVKLGAYLAAGVYRGLWRFQRQRRSRVR